MDELLEFSLDTENAEKNYNLARWYEVQGHTAPALTYYLRASERASDKLLAYSSLLRASFCYKKQGSRDSTEKILLENALMLLPDRPEAYYFLSLFYEKKSDWQNCYIYSSLGLNYCKNELVSLDIENYPGEYALMIQKAVSGWWWGKGNESKEIFSNLYKNYWNQISEEHQKIILSSSKKIGLDLEKRKVIDCFRFFNEKELLELRYHILKDHVDEFIILEGTKTQSGVSRKELLAKKYIKELNLPEDKFVVIEVDLPGNDEEIENTDEDIIFRSLSGKSNDTHKNSLNARTRERILINSLLNNIEKYKDNDIFFISDCDEIINPKNISYFSDMVLSNQNYLIKVPLVELQGKANLRAYHRETNLPVSTDNVFFMCTKSHFRKATPFQMRFNINNPYETVYIIQDGKRIEDCGWHFSWMGDSSRLKMKQKSTSHYADHIESAVIKDMNSKELENYIDEWHPRDNGLNPWGDESIVLQSYDLNNLPSEIFKFPHLTNFFISEIPNVVSDPFIKDSTTRTDIINLLIKNKRAKKYLEIGVASGNNISEIECEYKVGVDPNPDSPSTFHLMSNDFFEQNKEKFDIIFIDGLHRYEQVYKDILNSLDILNPGGYIVCHDMNPTKEEYQRIYPVTNTWNGDSWKAFVRLRSEREDLEMFVVDTDHGCGIIKKGFQTPINSIGEISYENLDKNRKEWLNLIEVKDFKRILKSENESIIPVIGVPIVNGVNWLKRLLDSIDYPVKEFYIINNNGKQEIDKDLDEIVNTKHPFIDKIRVSHLPSNLGVSGAWNLIIKSYINSPYWIIANNDISFTPGLLKKMHEEALSSDSGIIHAKESSWGGGSYDLFLLKDWVVQECGLFDENLYPAYAEDVDYHIRISNKNIKSSFLKIDYLHGESDYETSGSQTWRLNIDLKEKLDKSRILNENEYLVEKWGNDYFYSDAYSRPFNNENYEITYTKYDLNFVRKKYMGF